MRIHCPHCLEETELENSVSDSVITCAACKAVFDPRKKETLPHFPATGGAAGAGSPKVELLPGICAGDGFGGYVLERKLGRGGMGVVFAATQLSLGRKVAIKVLAHDLLKDPEFVQRFDREARVLASLNHPNIVQVIDKGIERGNVFLVMEHVDGVSLREVLSEKKLPPTDALKIIPQLCDALEYAHSRGVIHRDIKPENILVARDGTVKIADFGLAKIVGEAGSGRITRTNAVMGSLDYMAPEQRERTRDADHRSDIYALGVVFYEMLTGELPIGRFEPPSKKVKLEVDLDEVVLRVLAKDPDMRYQRASEVAAEIRRRSGGNGGAARAAEGKNLLAQGRAENGPWTAGGRVIRGLCDDIATGGLFRRVIALAILLGFWWLFLALAAIEGTFREDPGEVARRERERHREEAQRAALAALPVAASAAIALWLGLTSLMCGTAELITTATSQALRYGTGTRSPFHAMVTFMIFVISAVTIGAGLRGIVMSSGGKARGMGQAVGGLVLGMITLAEVLVIAAILNGAP